MKQNSLETTDIFRGAFFLCMGGDLCRIRIKDNRRRIASFMIRGKDLNRLDREYRSGKALVNPLQLRESLNHLRDILFDKLRENDPASRERYAVARGRTRDDRKREDRGVKKEH
jgi:hypothetical protein